MRQNGGEAATSSGARGAGVFSIRQGITVRRKGCYEPRETAIPGLDAHIQKQPHEGIIAPAAMGSSGATLERPGMGRVRDLVAAGGVSVVLAQERDRFSREPAYT
jgi:hypothetical protein